jgi:hypothetical protein
MRGRPAWPWRGTSTRRCRGEGVTPYEWSCEAAAATRGVARMSFVGERGPVLRHEGNPFLAETNARVLASSRSSDRQVWGPTLVSAPVARPHRAAAGAAHRLSGGGRAQAPWFEECKGEPGPGR